MCCTKPRARIVLVILEVWKDEAGLMSHDKAASTLHFRDELEKI